MGRTAAGLRLEESRDPRIDNYHYLGGRSRRMKAGTIQRIRDAALRQGGLATLTRAIRQRHLSTENGHAALRLGASPRPGVTRAYQSDSSSKRPAFTVDSDSPGGSPKRRS
jgi:hypothetical protein